MNSYQILAAAIIFAALCFILIRLLVRMERRRRMLRHAMMDDLEGHDFEYYCAELLEKNGFHDVEVTKGSGDYGADILAERDGISYAIQCKCYDSAVGVFAVQEVYAGRDFYDCMVGAVMTNQYFTVPAQTMARKLGILLWDRDEIFTLQSKEIT